MSALQRWFFSFAVGSVSRLLVLRDRLLGRLRPVDPVNRHAIASDGNPLDAALVLPDGTHSALLICHGIGETIDHWPRAQALLADQGVASLVFNYAGFGRSPGRVSAGQCERDAVNAFHWLHERLPGVPIILLGFSLGSGVATAVSSRLDVSGLVLCEAYTSFREAAARMGSLPALFPRLWPSEAALRGCRLPVLIVHGDRDRLFPISMAERLAAASRGTLAIVPDMGHADLHAEPRRADWQVIVDWLRRSPPNQFKLSDLP